MFPIIYTSGIQSKKMHHVSLQLTQMRIREQFHQLQSARIAAQTPAQTATYQPIPQQPHPSQSVSDLNEQDDQDVPTELSRTISTLHDTINQITAELPTEDVQHIDESPRVDRPTLDQLTEKRETRIKKIKRKDSSLDPILETDEPISIPEVKQTTKADAEPKPVKKVKKPTVPKIKTEVIYISDTASEVKQNTKADDDIKQEESSKLVIKRKPVKKVISATIAAVAK